MIGYWSNQDFVHRKIVYGVVESVCLVTVFVLGFHLCRIQGGSAEASVMKGGDRTEETKIDF